MTPTELHRSLTAGLYELHWFENAWTKTLGRLGRSDTLHELGFNIRKESAYSQEHVNRISKIFTAIGEPIGSMQTKKLSGLVADLIHACSQAGQRNISCDAPVIRAVIIAANYQVEAYNILLDLSNAMQNPYVAGLLTDTISQMRQTIAQMTELLLQHEQ